MEASTSSAIWSRRFSPPRALSPFVAASLCRYRRTRWDDREGAGRGQEGRGRRRAWTGCRVRRRRRTEDGTRTMHVLSVERGRTATAQAARGTADAGTRCRARGTRTAPPPPSLFDAAVALERSFMTRAAIERPRGRPTLRHPLESSRRAKGSVAFFFAPPRVRRRRPGGSCPRSARESGRRATCARAVRCGRCDACGARDVRRCASSRPELSR